MKELLLIILPLGAAVVAFAWPADDSRPLLLPFAGGLHALLTSWLLIAPPPTLSTWLAFDPLTRAVLPVVSLLFLVCALYAVPYLRIRKERSNRTFVAALLLMLGFLSLSHQAQHLGLLWISVEAVTLSAVPLLHFNNRPEAYEATWKYLLVGGTGIALSLLGSFFLAYAALHHGFTGELTFHSLRLAGEHLSRPWLLAAWVLLLVGYGTKMGLAPLHTWKPDAYGEAPGIVGAMMAGGVTTAAFTAILRVRAVVEAGGQGGAADRSLLVIGLFSMVVAAFMLLATRDFKRMLAYSSIEQMGILAIGTALGAPGLWAAFFHVWGNALTKGTLFMSAGNIRRAMGGRTLDKVGGVSRRVPRSAALFLAGMFAVTALPPFAPFFSELKILQAAYTDGRVVVAGLFLASLLLAFLGLSRLVLSLMDGPTRVHDRPTERLVTETGGVVIPPLVLLLLSLWLGLATPTFLSEVWTDATLFLLSTK